MPSLVLSERLFVKYTMVGTVVYGPGGTYGPRIQPDLQLVLLHTGSMRVEIDRVPYTVPNGHVALLKPGREEQFFFDEKRESWHRWIAVRIEPQDPALIRELDRLPFCIPLSEKINALTDITYSLLNSGGSQEEEVMKSLGKSAILLYAAECERLNVNVSKHPSVLLAKELMHRQFAEDLRLDDMAKSVQKTPEHLIRLFQRDEGLTPIQYLWLYRVKQGLALLQSTGLGVGEIAEQVGFKTSYHFARTIRRHTGKTPSEIRKESYRRN